MRMASSLIALFFGFSVAGSAFATEPTMPGTTEAPITSESQPPKTDVKKVSKKSKKTKKTKKMKKKAKSTKTDDEAAPPAVQ